PVGMETIWSNFTIRFSSLVNQKRSSSQVCLLEGRANKLIAYTRQWLKDKVDAKQKVKGKERKIRKLYLVFAIVALFGALGSVFSIVEFKIYSAEYHGDMSLAQAGIQHLRTGVKLLEALPRNSLDTSTVQKAGNEFTAGLSSFVKLNGDLK